VMRFVGVSATQVYSCLHLHVVAVDDDDDDDIMTCLGNAGVQSSI